MEFLWKLAAKAALANKDWLMERAAKTPYTHLTGYMLRNWIFNPYSPGFGLKQYKRIKVSARIHHILRSDFDRHLHDHPWDARTIILEGWYKEIREDGIEYLRQAGDTMPLRFGEYHRITEVSPGGVKTLFLTFGYKGDWGFDVDGEKVQHDEYFRRYGFE